MPRLFDLLSDRSDKEALKKLQQKAIKHKKGSSQGKRIASRNPSQTAKIRLPNYVALDVETTGLDPKRDRIIEIGIVRFINGKPREEYATFVNPERAIPPAISELTGITDQDVASAPLFKEIMEEVLEFIGSLAFCGHQIDFDFSFFNSELKRAHHDPIRNWQLDTASLSRLLLPNLPGYSLGQVAKSLSITLDQAHRALDDARASGYIALNLIPKLESIPLRSRSIMGRFAPPSMLKTILNHSIKQVDIPAKKIPVLISKKQEKLSLPKEPDKLDKEIVSHCFSQSGELSQAIPNYSCRSSQEKMATMVTDALNEQCHFIAEAGTGTGKSLAYVVPAALWAKKNNCRVLIATYTKNLQDQLVQKELPVAKKIAGKEFRYSLLKGRSNYLCRLRWNRFLAGELGNLSARERLGILPLIKWAEETTCGDIEEQNQFNRKWYPKVWSLISAESQGCLKRQCPLFQSCFLQAARYKAQTSHVVVINHALFFSEICSESSFLGKMGPIIFDEAHHIESCGHKHLRSELDTNRINRHIELCNNLTKSLDIKDSTEESLAYLKKYKTILKRYRKNSTQFLQDIAAWAKDTSKESGTSMGDNFFQIAYRDNPFSAQSGLSGFQLVLKDLIDFLYTSHQFYSDKEEEAFEVLLSDITGCLDQTSQLKADTAYLTSALTEDHVFWIEGDTRKGWIKLCGVPLDVGNLLYSLWKQNNHALIFTSATLLISDSTEYFKKRVGLIKEQDERTFSESFKSPFAQDQMLTCALASDLAPDSAGYYDYVAQTVVMLSASFNKNILVLFTANTMLERVYSLLRKSKELPADRTILAQGFSGTRASLLERLQESQGCILLGTNSFWEGIDAPGEACEMVVMPRLPFIVPSHPLTQALSERIALNEGDAFFNYHVPEALTRFRQGAGRLIRTVNDRGVFLVLDSRLITKSYGKIFQRSLDNEFEIIPNHEAMQERISIFFSQA